MKWRKEIGIYEFQKPLLSSRGCVQAVSCNNNFLLFYHHFAIHTKYTDKIFKKDEAREPKEAKKACE